MPPPRAEASPAAIRLDGVLVIDKPPGPTSHDVVAAVRRIVAPARVGHTGTLDPIATGVLPLVIGRATRLSRFLTTGTKAYRAEVRLGVATDSYDAEGSPVALGLPGEGGRLGWPEAAAVEAVLAGFRGAHAQTPPPFSAKKVGGTPAHRLARRDRAVQLQPVPVVVHRLALLEADGPRLVLEIECSAGFYVRALAHAIGVALGCGAHLAALRRTRSGDFGEDAAHPLGALLAEPGRIAERLVPLDRLLPGLPAARLGTRAAERVGHGQAIAVGDVDRWEGEAPAPDAPVEDAARRDGQTKQAPPGLAPLPGEGMVRLLDPDDRLLALARRAGGVLQPAVVLV
jgi:tRNA pseudouridine55 synthase